MEDLYGSTVLETIQKHMKRNPGMRGIKSRLAKAAGFSNAFFSQVLAGRGKLNADQAIAIAACLGFSERQTDHFVACSSLERAQSEEARRYFFAKMKSIEEGCH